MEDKKKVYSMFIEIELIQALRKISKTKGISISFLVNQAIKEFLKKNK